MTMYWIGVLVLESLNGHHYESVAEAVSRGCQLASIMSKPTTPPPHPSFFAVSELQLASSLMRTIERALRSTHLVRMNLCC